MKRIVVFTAWIALILAAVAAILPDRAAAQRLGKKGEGTVIAIPLDFPQTEVDDARAVVYRTSDQEIILVNPDFATPETLAASFALLKKLRQGRVEAGLTEASVVAGFSERRPMKGKRRETFAETLELVAGSPLSTLGDLGPGRWILVPRGFALR